MDIGVAAIPTVQVPDVVGQLQSDAITALAEAGLRTGTVNYVYDANVPGRQGDRADAECGRGGRSRLGGRPDGVDGKPARSGAQRHRAVPGRRERRDHGRRFHGHHLKATNDNVPPGDVAAQSPAAGVVTAAGSTVTITVSTGPAPASAPTPSPRRPRAAAR